MIRPLAGRVRLLSLRLGALGLRADDRRGRPPRDALGSRAGEHGLVWLRGYDDEDEEDDEALDDS